MDIVLMVLGWELKKRFKTWQKVKDFSVMGEVFFAYIIGGLMVIKIDNILL